MVDSYIICECGESKGNHKTPWTLYGDLRYGNDKTNCAVFSAARGRHNEQSYKTNLGQLPKGE